MNVLILKLGATGDVVRTTPLLHVLDGPVTWITESKNKTLVEGVRRDLRCLSWEEREKALDSDYDLVINLEDTVEAARFLDGAAGTTRFGAYLTPDGGLTYTENSREWFDLSLISSYGKLKADKLKLQNRKTYQEMIFGGLGWCFAGEPYLLPAPIETDLSGDVALSADSGPVWPMKKWSYYGELKHLLEQRGYTVNILPKRSSLLEHLADVRNHRCLVGGDSLPMHFALGSGIPCVTLFNCTSPWEIYDYAIQTKVISPLLKEFFYKRGYDERATTAISVDEVSDAVMSQLERAASPAARQNITV